MKAVVVKDVSTALWSTGLTEEILREAVRRGEAGRRSATAHAPAGKAGYNAWADTVTALRDLLVPLRWTPQTDHGLELVVSPCGQHAILVVSGDKNTGVEQEDLFGPRSKRPRGEATEFAVNQSQLSLDLKDPRRPKSRSSQGRLLWVLLIHSVKGRDEVRAELSLSGQLTDAGYMEEWHHRHVLGIIVQDAVAVAHSEDTKPSESEVEVKRKS